MTHAKRLDAWMMLGGYTDRTLAEAIGVDPSYVWYIRKGKRPVTDRFRWRFAEKFGFDEAKKLFDVEPVGAK